MAVDIKRRTLRMNGFTLFEMLLLLAVLALIATISLPMLREPAPGLQLRAMAYDLVNKLRKARGAAIKSNKDHTMTIDVAARRYWVEGLTKPSRIPKQISVDVATVQREQINGRRARMRFRPDGTSSGGTVILTNGALRAEVRLNWLTGHASLVWRK